MTTFLIAALLRGMQFCKGAATAAVMRVLKNKTEISTDYTCKDALNIYALT